MGREIPAVAGQEQRPAELTAGPGTGRVGAETAQQYEFGLRELPSSKRFQVVGHARPTSATSKPFHHPPKEPDLKMIRPVVMRVEPSEADPQPPPCLSKSRDSANRFCPFGRSAASVDASELRAGIFIAAKSPRRAQHRYVRHGLSTRGKGAAVERHGGAAALRAFTPPRTFVSAPSMRRMCVTPPGGIHRMVIGGWLCQPRLAPASGWFHEGRSQFVFLGRIEIFADRGGTDWADAPMSLGRFESCADAEDRPGPWCSGSVDLGWHLSGFGSGEVEPGSRCGRLASRPHACSCVLAAGRHPGVPEFGGVNHPLDLRRQTVDAGVDHRERSRRRQIHWRRRPAGGGIAPTTTASSRSIPGRRCAVPTTDRPAS